MDLRDALRNYKPFNEQEEKDREQILYFLERGDLVYTRESKDAHMTASAWVTNRARVSYIHLDVYKRQAMTSIYK